MITEANQLEPSSFEPSLAEGKKLEDINKANGSPKNDEEKQQAEKDVEEIYSTDDSRDDNTKVYRGEIKGATTLEELRVVVERLRSTEEQFEEGVDGADNSEGYDPQANSEFVRRTEASELLVEAMKSLVKKQTEKIELWDRAKLTTINRIEGAPDIKSLNLRASAIGTRLGKGELDQTRADELKEVVEKKRVELNRVNILK